MGSQAHPALLERVHDRLLARVSVTSDGSSADEADQRLGVLDRAAEARTGVRHDDGQNLYAGSHERRVDPRPCRAERAEKLDRVVFGGSIEHPKSVAPMGLVSHHEVGRADFAGQIIACKLQWYAR